MPRIFMFLLALIPWLGAMWLGFTMMNLGQVGPLIGGFLIVVFVCAALIIWAVFKFGSKG